MHDPAWVVFARVLKIARKVTENTPPPVADRVAAAPAVNS